MENTPESIDFKEASGYYIVVEYFKKQADIIPSNPLIGLFFIKFILNTKIVTMTSFYTYFYHITNLNF